MEIEDHWRDKEVVRAITVLDMVSCIICGLNITALDLD